MKGEQKGRKEKGILNLTLPAPVSTGGFDSGSLHIRAAICVYLDTPAGYTHLGNAGAACILKEHQR